jgi:hypothetical protein
MRTYLECIPCFVKQALEASKVCKADPRVQKRIVDEICRRIPDFPLDSCPPEMGRTIHNVVKRITGIEDPYTEIKKKSNELAMAVYGRAKLKLERSNDRMLTALELAVAGNIIDFGVKNSLDVDKEIERIISEEDRALERESAGKFDRAAFQEHLSGASDIMYLADNAGETVFDRILIEEISGEGRSIQYAVKEKPIINDALLHDAEFCGIDRLAEVISSGSDAPGTVPGLCSAEFLARFYAADVVISKGQGNFEALSSIDRPVFFLFMAKCPVIASHVKASLGDIFLIHHRGAGTARKVSPAG